jgi:protein TonB
MRLLERARLSKHSASVGLALTVTITLVLLMQHLIEADENGLNEPPKGHVVDFQPVIEDTPPVAEPRKVVEPPKPEIPPDVIIPLAIQQTGGEPDVGMAAPAMAPGDPIGTTGLPDTDLLPLVKVTPHYPERARRNNIEGYVLIEFTVDELGRVVDPMIIEAEPVGVFDRSAMEAVQRFKYRPRVLYGQPMVVTGVKHRLSFVLAS